ncbi:hypothetical protein NESM_000402800 [Novymonas esmeraldas]|uniref:Uncharacterized protein n=1 Tax=Novymonas esmeraldas TaxID=1808958 RepID=A0AAW0EL92_9TRYP
MSGALERCCSVGGGSGAQRSREDNGNGGAAPVAPWLSDHGLWSSSPSTTSSATPTRTRTEVVQQQQQPHSCPPRQPAQGSDDAAAPTVTTPADDKVCEEPRHVSLVSSSSRGAVAADSAPHRHDGTSDLASPSPMLAEAPPPLRLTTPSPPPPPPPPHTTRVRCVHGDLPVRYRDVPAYCCRYCAYTVCTSCWTPPPSPAASTTATAAAATPPGAAAAAASWLDALTASPATAVRSGRATGPTPSTPTGGGAPALSATHACHRCGRECLAREEALLHEWRCEGPPTTPMRQHSSFSHRVYDTVNLNTYYSMRANGAARLASTQPLLAQVHAVFACRAPDAAPAGLPLRITQHCHPDPVAGDAAVSLDRCDEGGSFIFSVHNPRVAVQLVWCAVDLAACEEAPAYALPQPLHSSSSSSSSARGTVTLPPSSSTTPLLLWWCPPSLPGLPARRYRMNLPCGLYANTRTHALALFLASDIFQKATTQLSTTTTISAAATATAMASSDALLLTSEVVAPSATLRALLLVHIMHHMASTPSASAGAPPRPPSTPTSAVAADDSNDAAAAAPMRRGPHELASPELLLCVDHLLHGRSIAVYGATSKHFFLGHVAHSAQLRSFHVMTVDALGSGAAAGQSGPSTAQQLIAVEAVVAQRRRSWWWRQRGGGGGGGAVGKRHRDTVDVDNDDDAMATRRRQRQQQQRGADLQQPLSSMSERTTVTDATDRPLVERAALAGDTARSPAVARDTTVAAVVDVDHSSSSSSSVSPPLTGGTARDRASESLAVAATPARGTVLELGPSPSRTLLQCTPPPLPPLMSPVPAFFAALRRAATCSPDALVADSAVPPQPQQQEQQQQLQLQLLHLSALEGLETGVVGSLHSPRLLSEQQQQQQQQHFGSSAVDVTWQAPLLRFASDATRLAALRAVRRHHPSRRCVRWVSLPSTTAAALLAEQHRASPSATTDTAVAPRMHLVDAHRLRPGWSPPVLLVLHNVDQLDAEASARLLWLLRAELSDSQTHVQLLCSFDNPRWPLTPLAAALERLGVCALQLRSLLLPRVHETRHVKSMRLLMDAEAAAGATTTSSSTAIGSGGGSHVLHDTMRRVLLSLPLAFCALLRVLVDVQEEMGEGQRIPLFTAKEALEQHGTMVSQARLKALLQELTSNRIAVYDMAEHALTVVQPRKLRKALDEVTAHRASAANAAAPAEAHVNAARGGMSK